MAALVTLGIALRAVYLLTPALDSDEAIVGLMARHILQGEPPIFYWGQPFAGTLESHLAALLFGVFGASRLTLALSPFLFSVAFMLLTYRLACTAFDRAAGLVALAMAAVPPPFVASHSVTARANYIENLVLGSLLLLLVLRLPGTRGSDRRRALLLLGFFAGLAWYQSPQSIHYLAAAGLFVLLRAPRLALDRAAWLVPSAFLAGSLPFWLYNLATPVTSFEAIYARAGSGPDASVRDFLLYKLPYVLGVATREAGPDPWLAVPVLALYAAALLYLVWRWRQPGARLLLLFLGVTLAIVVGAFNQGGSTRYLLPLHLALPVVMGAFLAALSRRRRAVAVVAAIGLLAVHAAANVARAEVLDPAKLALYRGRLARDTRLVELLVADGLTRVYVPDFWDAYRLTFDAGERVVFAEPGESFYPPYTRMVDVAERYAYVIRRPRVARAFDAGLRSLGGAYRRRELAGYAVFDRFEPPDPPLGDLRRAEWRVAVTDGATGDRSAIDADPFTSWTAVRTPALSALQLDLGAVRTIGQIGWLPRRAALRPPAAFRVETSLDGERWQPALPSVSPWPGLAWGPGPARRVRLDDSGRMHARFAPVAARWLRVTMPGDEPREWSIRELFVSGVGAEETPAGRDALDRGLRLLRRHRWTDAMRAFQQAVDEAPDWEEAHLQLLATANRLRLDLDDAYERGLALEQAGAADLAARAFWQAAQLFPHSHRTDPLLRVIRLGGAGDLGAPVARARRLLPEFTPAERIDAVFGGTMRLAGFTVDRREVEPGGQVRLSYLWECLRETRQDYVVFVHLRGNGVAAGDDHSPLEGLHPTSRWRAGESIRDDRVVTVPATAPPGSVVVTLGIWDPATGRRLAAEVPGGALVTSVRVLELQVTGRRAGGR